MSPAKLEQLCVSLKGTTTDVKWGNDLCYLVRDKLYCVTGLSGTFSVSLKTTPEDFAELIERDGIQPAPYTARYHWVMVSKTSALSPAEWQHYVKQSYQLVLAKLPAKLKKGLS
jgi:predicted DNA-binding protein (MmcQ/YjbR family)